MLPQPTAIEAPSTLGEEGGGTTSSLPRPISGSSPLPSLEGEERGGGAPPLPQPTTTEAPCVLREEGEG